MINFTEETNYGFKYYFTKGISVKDIKTLIEKVSSYCLLELPQNTIDAIESKEYFPTTKSFKNIYSWKFMSKEEYHNLPKGL